MKKFTLIPVRSLLNKVTMVLATLLMSIYAVAQDGDKTVDVNINTKSDDGFFTQPWVWIVGGAVFLLLLVALMRNNNSKD
jgi:hypothetical protein